MFQGTRQEAEHLNRRLGFDPKSVGAVLLSHAHIDHSGALPVIAKQGFSGKVHVTPATGDLTAIMLEDSARIQENDCAYVNKQERRRGRQCVRPFYSTDDVRRVARQFRSSRYGDTIKIAPALPRPSMMLVTFLGRPPSGSNTPIEGIRRPSCSPETWVENQCRSCATRHHRHPATC
jgi:Cft2 family RNA processing exonuclease